MMNHASMLRKSKTHRSAVAALMFRFDKIIDAEVFVPWEYMQSNREMDLRHFFPVGVDIRGIDKSARWENDFGVVVHIRKKSMLRMNLPSGFIVSSKPQK